MEQEVNVTMTSSEYRLYREWLDGPKVSIPILGSKGIKQTEDGKWLQIDEVIYGVSTRTWGTVDRKVCDLEPRHGEDIWKWFSTEEARQEYVEYHKECLSQKEFNEILVKTYKEGGSVHAANYREEVKCALDNYVMNKLSTNGTSN